MSSEIPSQESLPSSSTQVVVSEYFRGVQHVSMGDNANISTVYGDQHNHYSIQERRKATRYIVGTEEEEAEFEQFPKIKRGEFVAFQDIYRSVKCLCDEQQRKQRECVKRGERTLLAGEVRRIGGAASRCMVMQYSGQGAGELWKKDFWKFGGIRHPENAQLVAINLSNVPMLVLTGVCVTVADQSATEANGLLPWSNALDGHVERRLLSWATGAAVFARDLPLDAELVKEDVLIRYLGGRNLDHKVIWEFSLNWLRRFSQLQVNRPTIISPLTDTILAIGSGVWKVYGRSCVGEREELANGATRFTLNHNERDLKWYFDNGEEALDAWLAQAPSIFHAHGIPLEGDMHEYELVTPWRLTGTLSDSYAKQRRRVDSPTIYLFIPPLSTSTFWSFDPDGHNPITTDLCHHLGLPISLSLECWECSWRTEAYKALQAYQIARGFDPNTTEFARHNRYRIYEITNQPLPSRFKEIEDLEEGQSEDSGASKDFGEESVESEESEDFEPSVTSLRSVHREEAPDTFLSGKVHVQPEDLAASTTTQGHTLQNGVKYPSNYPHSNPAATFSAFTDYPCMNTAEINCTLRRDLKSVSPLAETSSRAHSNDLKTVPAKIEAIIPQPPTDIILPVSSLDIQKILCQKKTMYEFMSKQSTSPLPSFDRVWFYVTAPESSISYVCNVGTTAPTDGRTKGKGKTKTSDCTISFPIESLYRLRQPLALSALKQRFGFKSAPRVGTILPVPTSMLEAVPWQTQHLVWPLRTQSSDPAAKSVVARKQVEKKADVKRKAWR
ncbi:hypothetical protein V5O48_003146 [Marasmius crinis-equi]|uniref:Uncharacterized protein n=1 Tax=Marasmius crinis-equi TaxID=585013 RepID=A0ABR3FTR8_9AGAR